jgi:hypothetical protein
MNLRDKPFQELTHDEFIQFFTEAGFEFQLPHRRYAFKKISEKLKVIISFNDQTLHLFKNLNSDWFPISEPINVQQVIEIVEGLEKLPLY